MNLEQLQPYLPVGSLFYIEKWIKNYPLTMKITRNRQTKLGDYRKNISLKRNQITVNGDLNPIAFLFVLTHEIAHMHVYNQFTHDQVAPHGKEWKLIFGNLLLDSISIYPIHLQSYIYKHAKSPKASVGADPNISKYILDEIKINENFLEDLKSGDYFKLRNKIFKKGEKVKLRYVCCEIKSNRKYLINSTAIVEKINT